MIWVGFSISRCFHLPSRTPALDEAAQRAQVVGEADDVGADQAVAVELEPDVAPVRSVDEFRRFAAGHALPGAEGRRDQAQGVEDVEGEAARATTSARRPC